MNAVQLALTAWGFARVVIVGVHLDGLYEGYRSAWWPLKVNWYDRIRAIGGYTEQLFGRPSAAFVGALPAAPPIRPGWAVIKPGTNTRKGKP